MCVFVPSIQKEVHNCAATWQNQQNECAPSEDWDQPRHPPSLIRVFAVRMKKSWVLSYPLSAQRRLIRLGGCPGWSESSLGAHSFCWFCHVVAHISKQCRPRSDAAVLSFEDYSTIRKSNQIKSNIYSVWILSFIQLTWLISIFGMMLILSFS